MCHFNITMTSWIDVQPACSCLFFYFSNMFVIVIVYYIQVIYHIKKTINMEQKCPYINAERNNKSGLLKIIS